MWLLEGPMMIKDHHRAVQDDPNDRCSVAIAELRAQAPGDVADKHATVLKKDPDAVALTGHENQGTRALELTGCRGICRLPSNSAVC